MRQIDFGGWHIRQFRRHVLDMDLSLPWTADASMVKGVDWNMEEQTVVEATWLWERREPFTFPDSLYDVIGKLWELNWQPRDHWEIRVSRFDGIEFKGVKVYG